MSEHTGNDVIYDSKTDKPLETASNNALQPSLDSKAYTMTPKKCLLCEETRGIQNCHVLTRQFDRFFNTGNYIGVIGYENPTISLCPNHHWYFDHHLLNQEELGQLKSIIYRELLRIVEYMYLVRGKDKEDHMAELSVMAVGVIKKSRKEFMDDSIDKHFGKILQWEKEK